MILLVAAAHAIGVRDAEVSGLDALVPGLHTAVREARVDPDLVGELVSRASPDLARLLVPARPEGPLVDLAGEGAGVDLESAWVDIQGSVLTAEVRGLGLRENGAWIDLDLDSGPAPDLRIGAGHGWLRASRMAGWRPGKSWPVAGQAEVDGDVLKIRLDLERASLPLPKKGGAATARIARADGLGEDVGPAGGTGLGAFHAVELLGILAREPEAASDPDLALALALTFGAIRGLVDPSVEPIVDGDAVAWLRYAGQVDAWLAEQGRPWRIAELSPIGKLAWAWPAGQGAIYGAAAISTRERLLSAAEYRFLVPDTQVLSAYRGRVPLGPDVGRTADAIDTWTWNKLRYRASPEAMAAFCKAQSITNRDCQGWKADRRANVDLGMLGSTRVEMHLGTSASWQLGVLQRGGEFIGDCATATAIAMAAFQAVGIAPLAVGYAAEGLANPTHDLPLWLDGDRFVPTQSAPARKWDGAMAYVYVTVPAVDAGRSFGMGQELGLWARGGTVIGAPMAYGDLAAWLRDGISADAVLGWVDRAGLGDWPVP